MKQPGIAEEKMEERLNYAKAMMERFIGKKFEQMPIELQVKTCEIAISLFIQSEKSYNRQG